MTSTSPDEALLFRGKTLTPESPRPLHIPEPTNIPVLQNQMDPIFNDTSSFHLHSFDKSGTTNPPVHFDHLPHDNSTGVSLSTTVLQNGADNNTLAPVEVGADSFAASLHKDSDATGKENESAFAVAQNSLMPQPQPQSQLQPPPDTHDLPAPPPPSDQDASLNGLAPSDPSHFPPSLPNPPAQPNQCISYNQTNGHGHQDGGSNEGVNHQNLLDTLSPSTSTSPSAPGLTTTSAPEDSSSSFPPSPTSEKTLQAAQGLPPRPPPQDKPSIHPNYTASDNIRSFHQLPAQNPNVSVFANPQSNYPSNPGLPSVMATAPGAPGTASGASGLPPPPVATFQQAAAAAAQDMGHPEKMDAETAKAINDAECEAPWGPEVQKKYDKFLHDERIYVTEGLWDRFPHGSRLFIGNLPTERVTKRDLFHLFHKYGKLAQISIKQAYGFVQFLDSGACRKALQVEQGGTISKSQNRNETPAMLLHLLQNPPELSLQREDRDLPSTTDEPPKPLAAPDPVAIGMIDHTSHQGYHSAISGMNTPDDAMTTDPHDHLPLDLFVAEMGEMDIALATGLLNGMIGERDGVLGLHRIADLPIPRRTAREVPDVQIIVLDDVDRTFVYHIETAFRDRGLRSDVLILSPRIKLSSVIRRQIIEGVLAVVKVSRTHQYSRKISLQVFDRSGGSDNVRFNEYSELELKVAADVVIHAQNIQRGPSSNLYQNQTFAGPQLPPQQPQQPVMPSFSGPGNVSNLIATLDGPGLQSLLGALQQTPATLQAIQQRYPPSNGNPVDLASLLGNLSRQSNPQPITQGPLSFGPMPNPSFGQDSNLLSMLTKGMGQQPNNQPQQQQQHQQPHSNSQVQNIMDQLAKWHSK
ncbi:hypothetical protein FQN54_009404 [Arachnomyces sp. PD_36]|nr:hypothetical protein FQN54_009404 [Arachnomyces sp. PD_36]